MEGNGISLLPVGTAALYVFVFVGSLLLAALALYHHSFMQRRKTTGSATVLLLYVFSVCSFSRFALQTKSVWALFEYDALYYVASMMNLVQLPIFYLAWSESAPNSDVHVVTRRLGIPGIVSIVFLSLGKLGWLLSICFFTVHLLFECFYYSCVEEEHDRKREDLSFRTALVSILVLFVWVGAVVVQFHFRKTLKTTWQLLEMVPPVLELLVLLFFNETIAEKAVEQDLLP